MKNLSEIIEEIEQLKRNISKAKESFKNSKDELLQLHYLELIKNWQQSLRVLNWVIGTENTFTNK